MQVIIPLLSYFLLSHCVYHLELMKAVAKQTNKKLTK